MRDVNRKRHEREAMDPMIAETVIESTVRREVAHQLAVKDPTYLGFGKGSPLWHMKNDISAIFEALEDVYRNHGDRRSDPHRADRTQPADPRKDGRYTLTRDL